VTDTDWASFVHTAEQCRAAAQAWRTLFGDVDAEIERADVVWGDNADLPNGTDPAYTTLADYAKQDTDAAHAAGSLTWLHVLNEEVCEAFAETDPVALRAELVQVAATALRWVRALDTPP
jgi:hypothetical protein